MNYNELPNNSLSVRNGAKEPPKNTKKELNTISGGGAHIKEEKFKFFKSLLNNDPNGSKSNRIVWNIVIPNIKKIVMGALNEILPGGNANVSNTQGRANTYSYSNYYSNPQPQKQIMNPPVSRGLNFEVIFYESKEVAESCLYAMRECVGTYNNVSINDMFDISKVSHSNPNYTKYGWTNLDSAYVEMADINTDEWRIVLPPAIPLM